MLNPVRRKMIGMSLNQLHIKNIIRLKPLIFGPTIDVGSNGAKLTFLQGSLILVLYYNKEAKILPLD